MEEVKNIMNIMNDIEYGYLDSSKTNILETENSGYQFNQIYHLMSPTELLDKKVGVCWDQVELERKLFNDSNIKNETYFIYLDDKNSLPSHTFLVFFKDNSFYWFEHSWSDFIGIHKYNNLSELLDDVKIKFIKSREKEINKNCIGYIYKYNKPNYNISCDEFYKYIFTQEKVLSFKV